MTNAFLDNLDTAIAVITVILVLSNLVIFRRLSTCGIASIGFAVVQSLSVLVTPPIRDSLSVFSPQLSLVVFYLTFAFVNLSAIVLIYRMHNALSISIGISSSFVVRSLQLLALLQVARYLDRKFEFELLATVYKYSVPSINIAVVGALTYFTIRNFIKSRNMAGIKGI
jgi:hypothetical protein